ncbi:hypothetical protein BJ742DRAFT_805891 [Cladochytrium replicatum]|nr:hypothetical protein BJ742DRAFT_805891 [Cladochytrium replicatum]
MSQFLRRRPGRVRTSGDPYVVLLAMQTIGRLLQDDRFPAVTGVTVALNVLAHYYLPNIPLSAIVLNPHRVLEYGETYRIVSSAFFHIDDIHLFTNMASFVLKGQSLERSLGPARLVRLMVVLLLLSHGGYVLLSWALAVVFNYTNPYYSSALGFSAVIFALKVVLNHGDGMPGDREYVPYVGYLPVRYASWVELLVMHYLVPGSSLLGHACGVVAGLLFLNGPPALKRFVFDGFVGLLGGRDQGRAGRSTGMGSQGGRPTPTGSQGGRTWGSGRVGGSRPARTVSWDCRRCTYINNAVTWPDRCEMCGSPR